jgi:starch-binding outer membrane protein, SusD/RagB family
MKNLYLKIIIILLAIFSSCNDDYMERYPLDKISDETFWKSASDMELYANQFYPMLSRIYSWRDENMSDNQCPSVYNTFIWGEYVVPSSGGGWSKSDWSGIRSCNYFLQRYHEVKGDIAEIKRYAGEISFFKSYYYFEKVKQFGDVPWLSRDLQVDSEELYIPRDSRKLVMDSVVADLNFAIDNLPELSTTGRITKYAALALKARACLFEGTFRKYHNLGDYQNMLREAVNAAQTIINSDKFSVYSSGDPDNDFYNMFIMEDLTGNSECILPEIYIEDIKMHNRPRQLRECGTGFSKDFAETYLCTDGNPISLSPLYKGDSEFADEFVNRDPRMQQTIYSHYRPIRITNEGLYQYQDVPQFDHLFTYTGYMMIKGFSPTVRDFEAGRCTLDDFIFRYGEILLIYAEAKAELGECTQEDLNKSINLLRERVEMPPLNVNINFEDPNWPEWEVPVTPLINEIRRERRIELAVEGFRFDDLRRWKAGKLLENPKTYIGARNPETNEYQILYPGKTRIWDDKLYLYPLPTQERTLNPDLSQNPGWGN